MPRLSPQNKRLNGAQLKNFCDALISAYSTPAVLDEMLQFNLGKKLSDFSLANDMPTLTRDVINKAEDQAWSRELLTAALTSNRDNPELLAFSQQFDPIENERRQRLREIPCPYRGLEVFDVQHAANYFGRQAMVQKLLAKLSETSFIAVVGPSGCGKSSLLRAGMASALRDGHLPGSQHWRVAFFRPGN